MISFGLAVLLERRLDPIKQARIAELNESENEKEPEEGASMGSCASHLGANEILFPLPSNKKVKFLLKIELFFGKFFSGFDQKRLKNLGGRGFQSAFKLTPG
jgi:hypothetical protein